MFCDLGQHTLFLWNAPDLDLWHTDVGRFVVVDVGVGNVRSLGIGTLRACNQGLVISTGVVALTVPHCAVDGV